jgi:hypothetical protein
VRAEAGQAKANGKLIPVKAGDIGYGDIPLPFGEMHTEPLSNTAQIRAAVVAQLAKPQVVPSGIWMATADVRYAFLTWFGIIGAAITLFSSLKGFITLADWAAVIVRSWNIWTQAFWAWTLGWLNFSIPEEWGPLLNFGTFVLATLIGTRLALNLSGEPDEPSLKTAVRRPIGSAALVAGIALIPPIIFFSDEVIDNQFAAPLGGALLFAGGIAMFYFSRDRAQTAVFVVLFALVGALLALVPVYTKMAGQDGFELLGLAITYLYPMLSSFLVFFVTAPAALALLPARRINRKLLLIVAGWCALLVLNEISRSPIAAFVKQQVT